MSETITDPRTGETLIKIKPGDKLPEIREGASEQVISKEVLKPFKFNRTITTGLDARAKDLKEGDPLRAKAVSLYNDIERAEAKINSDIAAISKDMTRTPGGKLVKKSEMVDTTLGRMDEAINDLSKELHTTIQQKAGELFSSNASLSPSESQMLPIYAYQLQNGDSGSIGQLAGSQSPTESKIALQLLEHYPNLLPEGHGYDMRTLGRIASTTHTPEIVKEIDQLTALYKAMDELSQHYSSTRRTFVNTTLLERIKKTKVK